MVVEIKKRAQLTLFIILAIIVVVAIVAAFFLIRNADINSSDELNPREFMDKCVRDAVEPSIENILEKGGMINPPLFKLYQGEIYNFLCYQSDYYSPCLNIHPLLESISESEIRSDSLSRIQECFDSLKTDLESRSFEVSEKAIDYSIDIVPGMVKIKLEKEISIRRGDSSQKFNNFDSEIISPLYDLIRIAREIVNQEAQYCNFEYNGFMLLYPQYDIKRMSYDEARIYSIQDRRTGKTFKFAVRSCAFPPGL